LYYIYIILYLTLPFQDASMFNLITTPTASLQYNASAVTENILCIQLTDGAGVVTITMIYTKTVTSTY